MFCHYMDAFAPWFSWHQRLTCRQAAAFPGSDLGASELVVSSRVPKCLHRMAVLAPQNGGQKARRQTRPLSLASPVPCLRGAVELLLTGDQHKPCASFNQQARKNTTSVAEGKRKTPQKIASKGAKIYKKASINPQKRRPNSDRYLRDTILRSHTQTAKANATYQD